MTVKKLLLLLFGIAVCTVICMNRAVGDLEKVRLVSASKAPHGIKHAVFINLAHRRDRLTAVENELDKANIPHRRVAGVVVSNSSKIATGCWDNGAEQCLGQLGCKMSHIRALELALHRRWSHVAIFEDDFTWLPHVDPVYIQRALGETQARLPNWDVIAIGLRLIQTEPLTNKFIVRISDDSVATVVRIKSAATTHAYLVKRAYLQELQDSFVTCNVTKDYGTAIDSCWMKLQKTGNWYGFTPQLGTQRQGYSDIEKNHVNLESQIAG